MPADYSESAAGRRRAGCPPRPPTRSTAATGGRLFGDAELDRLAGQVTISNQNVAAAVATYAQAQALVREAACRAVPDRWRSTAAAPLGGGVAARALAAATRCRSRSARAGSPICGAASRATASTAATRRTRQASEADLAAARLSAQGALAIDYFALREADCRDRAAARAASRATSARCRSRRTATTPASIAQDRRAAGADAARQHPRRRWRRCAASRERFEHAIAVLIGKAPGDFAIAPAPLDRARCRRSRSACRRCCCSVGPTSLRPNARSRRPTPRSASQRVGLLSEPDAERLGRHRRPARRRPVQRLEPALVARPLGGADAVRRRRDAGARRRRRGRAATRRSRATARPC